jgi:AhpD family alkylhydroperoxidase
VEEAAAAVAVVALVVAVTAVETVGNPIPNTTLKREPSGSLFLCLKTQYLFELCKKIEMSIVSEFNEYREKMNEVILSNNNLVMKRLWNLDTKTYDEGALDKRTKEMLGLVSSMVLRCDDCIKYHLGKCHELGITTAEVYEVFSVANIVGGTIVIPHTRRAAEYWEALMSEAAEQ